MRTNNTLEKLCTLIKMNGNHDHIIEYAYMALFFKYCSYIYEYKSCDISFHQFAKDLCDYICDFKYENENTNTKVYDFLSKVNFYCKENNFEFSSFIRTMYLYVGSIETRNDSSIIKFLNSLSFEEVIEAINMEGSLIYNNSIVDDSVYKLVFKLSEVFGVETNTFCDLNSINGSSSINISSKFENVIGISENECNYLASICRIIVNKAKSKLLYTSVLDFNNLPINQPVDVLFGNFNDRIKRKTLNEEPNNIALNKFNNFAQLKDSLNFVNNTGVVMGILPISSLRNYSERLPRASLVETRRVKAVILLPKRITSYTLLETALVILSNEESNEILMLDASSYSIPIGRYQNAIDVNRLVQKIYDILHNHEENYFADIRNICMNDYCLLPSRAIMSEPVFKDSITLDNVAEVFTGWQAGSSKLEKLKTNSNKGIELLQASNIDDNGLLTELNRYAIPDYTVANYKLEPYDILLSTKSSKPKIYMVETLKERIIVPFGSFIVIRPYLDKIDPYFLECFLQSDEGQRIIKNYQTGTLISNLSIGNVKQLPIPKISIERQVHIGERYKRNKIIILEKLKRINELRLRNKMLISKEFEMYDL